MNDDPSTDVALLALFDLEGGHKRVESRMRSAIDGNGLTSADLRIVKRTSAVQSVIVETDVTVSWQWNSRTVTGHVGGIERVGMFQLKPRMNDICEEWSQSQRVSDIIQHHLTSSAKGGMTLPASLELGMVPGSVGYETHCTHCHLGRIDCRLCYQGRVRCNACGGRGQVLTDLGSAYRSCYPCRGTGEVSCVSCAGRSWTECHNCAQTGIITTVAEGTVSATVERRIRAAPGFNQSWVEALTAERGHAWLIDLAAVHRGPMEVGPGWVSVSWRLDLPVLSQEFEIGTAKHRAAWLGKSEIVWEMPSILDTFMHAAASSIMAAQPVDAFGLASEYPFFEAIKQHVLQGSKDREATTVREQFELMASPAFLTEVRSSLAAKRDRIAASAVRSTWKLAVPASVAVAVAGMAAHVLIVPRHHGSPAINWGDVAIGLFGWAIASSLSYILAARAGRGAVQKALGIAVKGWPHQGAVARHAVAISVVLYGGIALLLALTQRPCLTIYWERDDMHAVASASSASLTATEGLLPPGRTAIATPDLPLGQSRR